MDFLIERMRLAECSQLRIVTRPDKKDVIEHALKQGATVIQAHPRSVTESLVLGMEGLKPSDVVLFGFPDTIWQPESGYRTLLEALEDDDGVALGVFHMAEPERSDVVTLDSSGHIMKIDVRPARPTSNLVWGCGAARRRALVGMERHAQPGSFFARLARSDRVRGVYLSDVFSDIGTRSALEQTVFEIERRASAQASSRRRRRV